MPVQSPESPATIRRIPATGDLLLVWNNAFTAGANHGGKRTPLTAAISSDDGQTWKHIRNLETDPDQGYAYTSITFHRDRALLSYYVSDRKTNHISSRFRSLPIRWFYEPKSPSRSLARRSARTFTLDRFMPVTFRLKPPIRPRSARTCSSPAASTATSSSPWSRFAAWQIAPELANLRGKLTLVPVVNEAAFARGSRVADDGLDLARTCPGRPDGSITEQTAHALSELIRSADYYIDLHTGGTTLSVWPLTGYMLHPQPDVLEKQRAMARAFNLPVIWGTDPSLDGRSMSVARDANVPAIYAEYLGGGRCSPDGIDAYVRGCLNVMSSLGMLDLPPPTSNVQFVVEDPRPNSGHMQSSYPSPADGYFEPAVELGQPISIGQPLGWIVDPLGQHSPRNPRHPNRPHPRPPHLPRRPHQ